MRIDLGFVFFHFKAAIFCLSRTKASLMIMPTVSLAQIERPCMPKRSLEGDRIEVFLDSGVNPWLHKCKGEVLLKKVTALLHLCVHVNTCLPFLKHLSIEAANLLGSRFLYYLPTCIYPHIGSNECGELVATYRSTGWVWEITVEVQDFRKLPIIL